MIKDAYTYSFSNKFNELFTYTLKSLINKGIIKGDADGKLFLMSKLGLSQSKFNNFFYGYKTANFYDYKELISLFEQLYNEFNLYDDKYCDYNFTELLIDESPDGNEMIKRILLKFVYLEKNVSNTLISYLDYYLLVSDPAWDLIVNFAMLNEEGRIKIKDEINKMKISVSFVDRLSNEILLLLELCNSPQLFTYNEISKEDGLKTLEKTFKRLGHSIAERFFRQMDFITDMDLNDWKIVTSFYMLSDDYSKISYLNLSTSQKYILDYSLNLLKDKLYCDEYEFFNLI